MRVITIIQLIYGLPSLLLMLFFLILPSIDRKRFKNPFYNLLQIDLFVNIVCNLNSWIALRFESEEITKQFSIFLESVLPGLHTTANFGCLVFFHLQSITALSLVLFRFSSVHVLDAEKYWEKYYPLIPVFGVLYCAAVLSPWWAFGNLVTSVHLEQGVLVHYVNSEALFVAETINPIFSMFYFLLTLLFGMWTTLKVHSKLNRNNAERSDKFIRKMDRVVLCNSILMTGNLLFLVISCVLKLAGWTVDHQRMMLQHTIISFTSDMVTLAMPYILLCFDTNIRKKFGLDRWKINNRINERTESATPEAA